MKRDVNLFIQDIIENIKDIESFSKGLSRDRFEKDKLKQNAIIRSLEIIGEAAKNVPNQFRERYNKIPWKDISGFRDVLSHSYFGVDLDRVWNIIEIDLPELKKEMDRIQHSTLV
jgi:uncharacterized protein with HEPN domain